MKKKILALVLIVALVASLAVALAACDNTEKFTFGLICLHDENSTYDKNFIDAAQNVAKEMGVKLIIKKGVDENNECYEAAVDLADQGCDVIFADSFGHEDYMIKAAKEYPNVEFCHATGTKAHTEKLANFHNAFASIYEGRYLAGIVAGVKLKEMYPDATSLKMGYVGAHPFAEVVSGYTSFYLGAKSVMNKGVTLTMDVQYTGSWYAPEAEENAANALIGRGAQLISQHADSMGAPDACELAGIPNVTYNISTKNTCGDTYLVGSKVNWEPYFKHMIECAKNNKAIEYDWTGSLSTGSVQILEFGNGVSEAAKQAVATAEAALKNGTLNVFDTATFTVNGKHLTSYMADVDTDADYAKDTEVISNGVFMESKFRSAPYFDIRIDGITELN